MKAGAFLFFVVLAVWLNTKTAGQYDNIVTILNQLYKFYLFKNQLIVTFALRTWLVKLNIIFIKSLIHFHHLTRHHALTQSIRQHLIHWDNLKCVVVVA